MRLPRCPGQAAWLVALLVLLNGCTLSFVKEKQGLVESVRAAARLEPRVGEADLSEVLAEMGSPDLMLPFGKTTRAYYATFNGSTLRGSISTIVAIAWGLRPTAALVSVGGETFDLARLTFDERRVLTNVELMVIPADKLGGGVALDSRVAGFFEDRRRQLFVREQDQSDALDVVLDELEEEEEPGD